MQYLLDRNTLSNQHLEAASSRSDLCVLLEVLDEADFTQSETKNLISSGIQILRLEKKHLRKLKDVMAEHGGNTALIDLYTGKGMADVAMIAYILSERENTQSLFSDEFSIVTLDRELIRVAESYSINCVAQI